MITSSAGNAGSITAPSGANNPEFLTDPNQVVYESGSSPDGSASEDNHVHIWSSAADPSEIERLTPLNGFDVVAGPASSPDGTQIAVHAFNYPEGGGAVTAQLHLLDPLSHTLEPIAGAYGVKPSWRPDGKAIAYINDNKIKQVDLKTGAITVLIAGPIFVGQQSYSPIQAVAYRRPTVNLPECMIECRPGLYFDSSERFRPQSITHFLGELETDGTPHHEICEPAAAPPVPSPVPLPSPIPGPNGVVGALLPPTCTLMWNGVADLALSAGADSWVRERGASDVDSYVSPARDECESTTNDCGSGERSAIYLNARFEVPGVSFRFLDYWWFYRYNDFSAFIGFNHPGDWEGVTVALRPDEPVWEFASYSSHTYYTNYFRDFLGCDGGPPPDPALLVFEGAPGSCGTVDEPAGFRPNVYVADGSHANYPRMCSAAVSLPTCQQVRRPYPENGHDGARTWENNDETSAVKLFPEEGGWSNGSIGTFTDWPGRWGDSEAVPSSINPIAESDPNAPRSPGCQQPHWSDPSQSDSATYECAPSRRRTATAEAASRLDPSCGGWLGAGVVAVSCDRKLLRKAYRRGDFRAQKQDKVSVRRHPSRRGRKPWLTAGVTASGLTQVMGAPLAPGDVVRVSGRPASSRSIGLLTRRGRTLRTIVIPSTTLRSRTFAVRSSGDSGVRFADIGTGREVQFDVLSRVRIR